MRSTVAMFVTLINFVPYIWASYMKVRLNKFGIILNLKITINCLLKS